MSRTFDKVRFCISDPREDLRRVFKSRLISNGFADVTETGRYRDVRILLEKGNIDVLITSSQLDNGDVGSLVQAMRRQSLGPNPFIVVIMLMGGAEPDVVRRAADHGPDDLLLMPVAPEQLLSRIFRLANGRKPFVVTHNYIGPDRRTQTRQFEQPALSLLAPNPLRAPTADENSDTFAQLLGEGISALYRMRVQCAARQLEWLAIQLGKTLRDVPGAVAPDLADNLVAACEELIGCLDNSGTKSVPAIITDMLELAQEMAGKKGATTQAQAKRTLEIAYTINERYGGRTQPKPDPAATRPLILPAGVMG